MKTYQLYYYCENNEASPRPIIRAMCLKCHDEKYPGAGQKAGFLYYEGEFAHTADIKCNVCKEFIRKYEDEIKEDD